MLGSGWSDLVLPYLANGVVGIPMIAFPLSTSRMLTRRLGVPVPIVADLYAVRRQSDFGLVRGKVDDILIAAAQPVVWPMYRLISRPVRDARAVVELRVRHQILVWEGLAMCAFVSVVAMFVAADGQRWYLRFACYAVIVAVLSRQLRLLLHGTNAREEMRRTLRNPFAQLVLVALTSFLALALAAYVLLRWPSHQPFQWPGLWLEVRQIFGFGHLPAIWQARHAGGTQVLTAVTGLSVYALLISQLGNPLALRRTDDDRIAIAIRLALAQQAHEAQEWLQRVESDATLSAEGLRAHALIALAADRRADALRAAQQYAALRRLGTDIPEDKDDARAVMLTWADEFLDGALFAAVASWLIETGMGDAALAGTIASLSDSAFRAFPSPPPRLRLTAAMLGLRGSGPATDTPGLTRARPADVPERLATCFVSEHLALHRASRLSWSRGRQVATAGTRGSSSTNSAPRRRTGCRSGCASGPCAR